MRPITVACVLSLYAGAALGNRADDILRTLGDSDRRTVLARMLAASGERCGEVVEAFRQGRDRQDNAYWSVRCSNGAALQIRVAPDAGGSTRITDCGVIARSGARPICFMRF